MEKDYKTHKTVIYHRRFSVAEDPLCLLHLDKRSSQNTKILLSPT